MGGIDGDDKSSIIVRNTFGICPNFHHHPHRPDVLFPLKVLSVMDFERERGDGGREQEGIVALLPFMTSCSQIVDPTARLR